MAPIIGLLHALEGLQAFHDIVGASAEVIVQHVVLGENLLVDRVGRGVGPVGLVADAHYLSETGAWYAPERFS